METASTIPVIILERPDTVLTQYKNAVENSASDWLIITDKDAELICYPKPDMNLDFIIQELSTHEFYSFRWKDAPKIFNREYFGIGLYKKSALKRLFNKYPNLTSEGLDLIVQHELKTFYCQIWVYRHNPNLTLKRFFRYGKGRAYYMKITDQADLPKSKLYLSYWKYYLAYLAGFTYGLITKPKDNNW